MGDFKELIVWRSARALAADMYGLTAAFPASEQYGLASQIRRAAASIPANIAESSGRWSDRDQARLYQIAIASSRELESHLLLANDLGFISSQDHRRVSAILDQVQRMLMSLSRYSRRASHVSSPKS
ncbi:MAG: four helix bundle protein [Gemmatimonadales bacterium]